jgi:Right handed beta helix region
MKSRKSGVKASIIAVFVIIGAVGAFALILPGTAQGAHLTAGPTCSVTVHHENAADNAIQSSINAYPGGTICIGAGTFPEQLTISSSNTILKGAGAANTIIAPNSGSGPGTLTFNTVDWDSAGYSGGVTCGSSTCVPLASIILVQSTTPPTAATPTTGVTIEDLTVNGSAGSANVACGDDYVGVDFQDAAGLLTHSTVSNVASPPASFGCQEVSGAIYSYNGFYYSGVTPSPSVAVTISSTIVTGYQKNGITCDDPGESCILSHDTVTGAGPITSNAQNGVQIAYGAYANVGNSTITGNSYTGSSSTNDAYANGYAATGILLYDPATDTTLAYNHVILNQIGIFYGDDGTMDAGAESVTIYHNTVEESNAYGIVASGAPGGNDSVTIAANVVDNEQSLNPSIWGAPGILLDTGTFTLTTNHLEGSKAVSGASNGAYQTVCAPSGYPIVCSSTENIPTAAIQGASESSSDPTSLFLSGNLYAQDTYQLATLAVNGGSVS